MKTFGWLPFLLLGSCGTNLFEQEVEVEKAAVWLARQTVAGGYGLLTAEELEERLDAREDLVLVDAMDGESFRNEHLPGARNFVFPKEALTTAGSWDPSQSGGKSEQDFVALLGADKAKPIVVYCGFVKCARSHNAALWARKNGYANVLRFAGGLYAWKGAGYPLEEE